MESNPVFFKKLNNVRERINNACERCGRAPQEVILMAVTKTHPATAPEMALAAGLKHIGENRVQELADKKPQVANPNGTWELIGPLQSNKAKLAANFADRVQTVDRVKIVNALNRHAGTTGRDPLAVLMQVNVGEDPAKHGCLAGDAPALMEQILQAKHLRLEGLMTIGELSGEEGKVRGTFRRLRELRDQLERESGLELPVLSMGMTGDLEWAIEEGSTLIRVGTALFGARE